MFLMAVLAFVVAGIGVVGGGVGGAWPRLGMMIPCPIRSNNDGPSYGSYGVVGSAAAVSVTACVVMGGGVGGAAEGAQATAVTATTAIVRVTQSPNETVMTPTPLTGLTVKLRRG